ncbi:MAG TPA: PIG-L family deacetylase [Pyrinomonadaceae bacterium]|nr:PIG-L family deacetylase [Pyrinomonadaceae bacterium]
MKLRLRRLWPAACLPLLLLFLPAAVRAQAPSVMDAAQTALALKRLQVLGSALYVAAHPDDENTALLAYLAQGRGVRAAYLSITRGDGGQNLIGTEQGALLGLVRTHELLAARRIDGAEQLFTRAVDFGFTKSSEEALRVWGRDAALADVVWAIRRLRPDVVITRFPTTGEGGHGQHTASAVLAREAFEAAGDPARFPEQLAYVKPWRPKRLLWNAFVRGGERPAGADRLLSVDVGAYNPLLGRSYTEIAAQSRSQHRSQGFGSAERRGPSVNYFAHLAGEEARADIFDGVDLSWRRVAGGEAVGRILAEAAGKYDASDPQAILPLLVAAHAEMRKLPEGDTLVAAKRRELLEVIRACAGLWMEAVASEPQAAPGAEVKITTTLVNRSDFPFRLRRRMVGPVQPVTGPVVDAELKNNQPVQTESAARLPAGSPATQPYWLAGSTARGLFEVAEQTLVGEPVGRPALTATLVLEAGSGRELLTYTLPVVYRWTDRVRGELYRPFVLVPAVAVRLEEKVLVFPERRPKEVSVSLKSNAAAAVSGVLRLRLPDGWASSPREVPVTLKTKGEEFKAAFAVTPPEGEAAGSLGAEFDSGGERLTRGLVQIDYEHIPPQTVFPEAAARLVRLDLRRRGSRVGYVMGSGDEVPEALRQAGYDVSLLSDEDLDSADLSRFDVVVVGVRAYNTRPRLRQRQARLLDYVERGGTLVAQYNTAEAALDNFALGPYPLKLSRSERVTDETAPVRVLAPEDPLLREPNQIAAADFEGWVQERGLNFPSEWDARYLALFEFADPGERPLRGATLVARHGRGTYVYTSLAFFRQLPAGVPGAYRLFVNMVSAGKGGVK